MGNRWQVEQQWQRRTPWVGREPPTISQAPRNCDSLVPGLDGGIVRDRNQVVVALIAAVLLLSSCGASVDLATAEDPTAELEASIAELEPTPVSEPAEEEIVPTPNRPALVEMKSDTPLCISADGVCATWLPDARDECVENYPLTQKSGQDTRQRLDFEDCVYDLLFTPFQGIVPERFTGKLGPDVIAQGERLQAFGWDQPQTQPTKWVTSTDVPKIIVDASREGVQAAEQYLGSFGPLTVFMVGNNLEDAEPVIDAYCRSAYPPEMFDNCQGDQGVAMREMATIFPGGNAFAQASYSFDKPNQSFVDNPCANDKNEFCAIEFPEELIGTRSVTAHEYFHVYQASQRIHRAEENPDQTPMPRWFEEGAAVYFEMILDEQEGWTEDPRERAIQEWQQQMREQQLTWPSLGLIDIESEIGTQRVKKYCGELCIGYLQYSVGFMAIAYLAQLTSDEKLIFDFYEVSKTENFYSAFEKTFGMTIDKFYAELDGFLTLPQGEQFEILAR